MYAWTLCVRVCVCVHVRVCVYICIYILDLEVHCSLTEQEISTFLNAQGKMIIVCIQQSHKYSTPHVLYTSHKPSS